MAQRQRRFDIFISAHSGDFDKLVALLPRLRPHGTVHVASSYLQPGEIEEIRPLCDFVHEPRHDASGYDNFALFCVRDMNRLARTPHFVKVDCDVVLSDDWPLWVEESLEKWPDAVLIGSHRGTNMVDFDISGELVRRRLGRELRVRSALKVNGSFYLGRTDFFLEHDRTMQILHDFIWAFRDGARFRPAHIRFDDDGTGEVRLTGTCRNLQGTVKEDEQRCLAVHAVGAGDRMHIHEGGSRIVLPDKMLPPSRLKLATKWVKRLLGLPMYHRGR